MSKIAAIIITKNEEQNIAACIKTVLWADEIIVLDCGSVDKTQDICREYLPKVKLYAADWPGFGKQKNRALALTNSLWVLSIDADERITPELKREILQTVNNASYVAYKIPRLSYFLGSPIRYCYGDKSDAPIRLIKSGFGTFSDDIIHERIVIIGGAVGQLRNKMLHFSFGDIEQLINKINNYSTLGATKLYHEKTKSSYLKAISHASWAFIKIYFLHRGFLDGWPGFIIAFNNFAEVFYKYAKLFRKNRENHLI